MIMWVDQLITVSLAVIMFGIGLSIHPREFSRVFLQPKELLLGLGLQMLFLPALFALVLLVLPMSGEWKMGFFLVSICPGGTTSNFISYLVGANKALSISLTSVNSFLILVTLPILMSWGTYTFLGEAVHAEAPWVEILKSVLLIILMPAMIGVGLRYMLGDRVRRFEAILRIVNIVLFAAIYGIKIFADKDMGGSGISIEEIKNMLPLAMVLHLISMLFSFLLANRLGVDRMSSTTLGIEVGLQNTTLALLMALTVLNSESVGKPALVFAMFTFFTTLAFAWITTRKASLKI